MGRRHAGRSIRQQHRRYWAGGAWRGHEGLDPDKGAIISEKSVRKKCGLVGKAKRSERGWTHLDWRTNLD